MFTNFWDKLAEGLAGRWTAQELGPALAFWGGGILAWVWHAGQNWQQISAQLIKINQPEAYIALIVGGLFLLTASSTAMSWLQPPVLRLLEGYWPGPLRGLRFRLARRYEKRLQQKEERWQQLAKVDPGERTAIQQSDYARLDAQLARYPIDPRHLMPTTLGNLLRSAEEYPNVRYGLAIGVCWPRLWLLLPEEAKTTLVETRQQLDGAVRFLIWSLLFAVWSVWARWAILVAIVGAAVAYWGALTAAGTYGDLLRAAFDLHHHALYRQMRWALPSTPAEDEALGRQLSEYLFRGTGSDNLELTDPNGDK
jgi:hypothetical protein